MQFIAADWGTTHLRAFRVGTDSHGDLAVAGPRTGPGIKALAGTSFAACLSDLLDDWMIGADDVPVIVSGMASSNIGWHEVPYVPCPARLDALAAARATVSLADRNADIIGGVSCRNPLGEYDVMRGEELQALGAAPASAAQLVILPGTHNKWVSIADDTITGFFTVLTGELFALLSQHSVLVAGDPDDRDDEAFDAGLNAIHAAGPATLQSLLFSTRARQLAGELDSAQAAAYLSGLLIGGDIATGLGISERAGWSTRAVTVVAEAALAARYCRALHVFGVASNPIDSVSASIAGYRALLGELGRTP
ncbi:MAG: 2-dehydro-3-deoxygalactonokinase [Pseudomonadota bacterium]